MRLRLTYLLPLVMLFGGCPEGPFRDGEIPCDPDVPDPCLTGLVCKLHRCPSTFACYNNPSGTRDDYPRGCRVDGVCDPERCETYWTCPDCSATCDPALVEVAPEEYLVSEYLAPETTQESESMGVDLDGDGLIDNKWGQLLRFLKTAADTDISYEANEQIHAGELLITMRIFRGIPAEPPGSSLVQVLLADVLDATPVFNGADEVRLVPDASTGVGLCGLDADQVFGAPFPAAPVRFPVPWPGQGGTALVDVARIFVSYVDATGEQSIDVGGGIDPRQVFDNLLPRLAERFNQIIVDDPSSTAATLINLFDGHCVSIEDDPVCRDVANGEGECDMSANPPEITATELRCNPFFQSALSPDIDIDGDGIADLISFGVRLYAVPVTIVD